MTTLVAMRQSPLRDSVESFVIRQEFVGRRVWRVLWRATAFVETIAMITGTIMALGDAITVF